MVKEALVVPRKILFGGLEFQGFLPYKERDFVSTIIKNHIYRARGDSLENDSTLKQIIPYVWIVNPSSKKVFLYQRGNHKKPDSDEHVETRYLGKYSGGVGGHIDRDTEEGSENPLLKAMMRELREEVFMSSYPIPRFVGYINDDSDSIGSVHFGLVAIAETSAEVKTVESEGLLSGRFYDVEEVYSLMSDPKVSIESWTRLSWPFVKNYLHI